MLPNKYSDYCLPTEVFDFLNPFDGYSDSITNWPLIVQLNQTTTHLPISIELFRTSSISIRYSNGTVPFALGMITHYNTTIGMLPNKSIDSIYWPNSDLFTLAIDSDGASHSLTSITLPQRLHLIVALLSCQIAIAASCNCEYVYK